MTTTPSQHDEASPPPSRDLDDLITRHLDGGLDAIEQRRLAALLEASPTARETLARYLRLESAIIRLASAGLLGRTADCEPGMIPTPQARVGASRWQRPGVLALGGGALAVVIVAGLLVGQPRLGHRGFGQRWLGQPRGGDVAFIADRWLELQAAGTAAEPDKYEPEGQEGEADDPSFTAGSPPRWLVAAMADEGMGRSGPDEG